MDQEDEDEIDNQSKTTELLETREPSPAPNSGSDDVAPQKKTTSRPALQQSKSREAQPEEPVSPNTSRKARNYVFGPKKHGRPVEEDAAGEDEDIERPTSKKPRRNSLKEDVEVVIDSAPSGTYRH